MQGRGTFCLSVSTEKRADKRAGRHSLPSTLGSRLGDNARDLLCGGSLSSTYNQSKTNKEPSGKCFRQNPPFIFLCSSNNLDKFSVRGHNLTTWPPLFLNRWNVHTLFKEQMSICTDTHVVTESDSRRVLLSPARPLGAPQRQRVAICWF